MTTESYVADSPAVAGGLPTGSGSVSGPPVVAAAPDPPAGVWAAQRFGNLELRPEEMQALVGGARVGLTVREFQVLAALAAREDRVLRRAEIYRQVWGGEMKHRDRAVDVFVRKVRTKLAEAAPGWVYIHTHFGIGYRFSPEPIHPSGAGVAL